ncbi:hypothetical protein [Mycolicibacterium sp.]|uniref:hypothetical protein n=1 Tax=Mycolicibacterium sp. TaxID=2320850 RepID=UPI003D10231E
MATVAAKLSNVGTKIQVGTAACAVAAAAALTPAVIANADVAIPAPTAPALTEINNIAAAPMINSLHFAEQGGWLWFGPARPDAPPKTTFLEFTPLALVPNFLKPFFGWTKNLNFQACVFGLSLTIGPYGTTKVAVSRGC